MTHPDLFEQAVAEAEAKQATVAKTNHPPLETVSHWLDASADEIIAKGEKIPEELELVSTFVVTLRDGERYDTAMRRNAVIEDDAAQTVYERMTPHDAAYPGSQEYIGLLKVRRGLNDLTWKQLADKVRRSGVRSAGVRELAAIAGMKGGTDNSLLSGLATGGLLVGFGQRLSVPVQGLGVFIHRYPSLRFDDLNVRQTNIISNDDVLVGAGVGDVYCAVILASRPQNP